MQNEWQETSHNTPAIFSSAFTNGILQKPFMLSLQSGSNVEHIKPTFIPYGKQQPWLNFLIVDKAHLVWFPHF